MSVLADTLRLRREEKRLEQKALAALVGVRQQTISRWEQGAALPSPARMVALAEALDLDAEDLHRLAGYLPEEQRSSAWVQFRAALARITELSDQELVLLLDACWEEHRNRALAAAGVTLLVPPEPEEQEAGQG